MLTQNREKKLLVDITEGDNIRRSEWDFFFCLFVLFVWVFVFFAGFTSGRNLYCYFTLNNVEGAMEYYSMSNKNNISNFHIRFKIVIFKIFVLEKNHT